MNYDFATSDELIDFLHNASDEDLRALAIEHFDCYAGGSGLCEMENFFWDEEDFFEFIPLLVVTEGKNISYETLIYIRDNLDTGGDGERYMLKMGALWMSSPELNFNKELGPYNIEQAYDFTLTAPNKDFLELIFGVYSFEEIIEYLEYDLKNEKNSISSRAQLDKYKIEIEEKLKISQI